MCDVEFDVPTALHPYGDSLPAWSATQQVDGANVGGVFTANELQTGLYHHKLLSQQDLEVRLHSVPLKARIDAKLLRKVRSHVLDVIGRIAIC